MDLPKNTFKAAIKAGTQQIGLWCSINDSTIAEMLAVCGFDWMMFDTEHAAIDAISIVPLLQAVAPYPVSPIVRPGSLNPVEIKKLLDNGAQTILIPYIQNADEARLAVSSVTYGPEGIRGVAGITRASRFAQVPDYHKRAREEICLLLQVETVEALKEIEAIAAVPGVDGIFVGPADLAASMGHPGNLDHPDVKAAVLDAIRRIRAAGLPAGVLTLDSTFLPEVIAAGSLFTAVDIDSAILLRGALAQSAKWKAHTK